MPVTLENITEAKTTILALGRMYERTNRNLGFDNIVDADKPDDQEHTYETTEHLPSAGAVPTYVSAFFGQQALKPEITFGRIGEHPYGSIKPKAVARTLTIEEATAYLWWFSGQLVGTPDQVWESYRVVIGAANVAMNGHGIFRLGIPIDRDEIIASDVEGTNQEKLWLALVCAAPFRLHGGLRADYRREVATKISAYLNTLIREENFNLLEFIGERGQWEQDKKYSKVIAGLDMFLVRFPTEDTSRLRLCTIGARYKDCAALVGVEYLRNLLNVEFGEIFMWIWTKGVADDMRRVFKKNEEITTMHSYLPYISSMKLAERSPYSATVNPSLHYFVHFAGALMGHQRSLNARLVGEGNMMDPLFNAQVLAYAKCGRANWGSQFRQQGSVDNLAKVELALGAEDDDPVGVGDLDVNQPEGSHPTDWWMYIQAHGSKIPRSIETSSVSHCLQIAGPRQNTIGNQLLMWARGRAQLPNRVGR